MTCSRHPLSRLSIALHKRPISFPAPNFYHRILPILRPSFNPAYIDAHHHHQLHSTFAFKLRQTRTSLTVIYSVDSSHRHIALKEISLGPAHTSERESIFGEATYRASSSNVSPEHILPSLLRCSPSFAILSLLLCSFVGCPDVGWFSDFLFSPFPL